MALVYYVTEASNEKWDSLFWSQQELIRADEAHKDVCRLGKAEVVSSILASATNLPLMQGATPVPATKPLVSANNRVS